MNLLENPLEYVPIHLHVMPPQRVFCTVHLYLLSIHQSRESWAALRRGTIHPFFEDEDYYHWKNWHRHLDREDERRKHRKGLEFRARSKDMAWLYLNEMKTREVMYWQLVRA